MPSTARVCYVEIIIDLLLAVLENIAVGYLGYRPYTREQETILQMINHVRDTLMYYTVGLPCAPAEVKGKTGKKRPRSTRGSGGGARNSEDDDDEAGAGPPATRRQTATYSLAVATTMCSVSGKEICPVCGKCHGGKESSSSSSDCVEVEVVEESPVAMTISSSSGDGGPEYQIGSDSSSSESSVAEDENTGGGDTEHENTGGGDAGLKEGQDVGSSSSSSDDDEEE